MFNASLRVKVCIVPWGLDAPGALQRRLDVLFLRIEIFQFFVDLDNVNNVLKLHHDASLVCTQLRVALQRNVLKIALDGVATRPVCQVPIIMHEM